MIAPLVPSTVDLILDQEPYLRRVARRLTRCESDADDLVQDTLLRAYCARDRFAPGTSVRAWTSTILRRLFITASVRSKRRGVQTDTDARWALDDSPSKPVSTIHDFTPDLVRLGDEYDDAVKDALERVPEIYRTPFLLLAVRNMSCAEIATLLGLPAGTVMSRLHRARQRLKRDLESHRPTIVGSARKTLVRRPQPILVRPQQIVVRGWIDGVSTIPSSDPLLPGRLIPLPARLTRLEDSERTKQLIQLIHTSGSGA